MWRLRRLSAPRVNLRRIASFLATGLLVASFATAFTISTPAWAAPAEWDGDSLTYDGNGYSLNRQANLPDASTEGDIPYIWIDSSSNPQKAQVIFFDSDENQPQSQRNAELVTYDFSPPGTYSNPSSPETIEVTVNLIGEEVDNEQFGNTCDGSVTQGLGWILCPVSNWLAEGVDWLYKIINDFLEVPPATADPSTGIYALWQVLLGIANVCFVIVFLAIIYSHLTSAGFSNYNIKVMLPRLLIAAILVNVSFWICTVAIDISNVLGHSIHGVFSNIRENMTTGADIDWSLLTVFILSAGTIGSIAGFAAAVGGSWIGLGFLLIAALAGVAFSVFVGFVILAARQAIITVLLILSPLAFVAFVLPSTQNLFDRWRKSFTTLLIFFPIFAVLFGGSGVAGAAIMNSADGKLHIALIGLATQFIPLVLTPLLIQFSSGLLGRIAGLANSSTRGWTDRAKNWAQHNADYHASNKQAKTAEHMTREKRGWRARGVGRLGLGMDQARRRRERHKGFNDEYLNNRAEKDWHQRLANGEGRDGPRLRQQYLDSHDMHKKSETYKGLLDQEAESHWQDRLDDRSAHYNRDIHAAVLNTIKTKDETEQKEARFEAIVTEMKAGVNPYSDVSDDIKKKLGGAAGIATLDNMATDMQLTTDQIALEKERKHSAEIKIQGNYAQRLKAEEDLRIYAGGIDGDMGAARVYAKAKSQISAEFMENVKNSRSTLEDYSLGELINLTHHGKLRKDKPASEYEIMAGIQEIMLTKGNNWSAQKLTDHVAAQGMAYDEDTNKYYNVDAITGARGAEITDSSEIERRRTTQQIFVDAAKQSGLKIKSLSGTDRGNAETGLFTSHSSRRIVRDISDKKISATRWAETDVDELQRTVQVLRVDAVRSDLDPEARKAVVEQINRALTNEDIAATIGTREKEILEIIKSYADDDRPVIPLRDKEVYESNSKVKIPTDYEPDEFYRGSYPTGPAE